MIANTPKVQHALEQWREQKEGVTTLQLLEVTDQVIPAVISALDSSAPLREFVILQGEQWSGDHIRQLAAGLAKHPELQHLKIIGKLGDTGAKAIADVLPQLTNLQVLDLGHNGIGAVGGSALAQAAQTHPSLISLVLENNNINSPAMEDFADLITMNPRIAKINLAVNNTRREDQELMDTACIESQSKNLISVVPGTMQGCVKTNSTFAKLNGRFYEAQFSRLMVTDIKKMLDSKWGIMAANLDFHGITFKETLDIFKQLESCIDRLPTIADLPELTPESLVSPVGGSEYGVLDNPRTWEILPEIIARLAAQGTPLTVEHLQRESRSGFTHVYNAASMGHFPDLVRAMNETGEQIPFDALLWEGEPGSTILGLLVSGEINDFFRAENWEGKSTRELNECLQVMKSQEEMAPHVPALHALKAHLLRQDRTNSREI